MTTPKNEVSVFMDQRGPEDVIHIQVGKETVLAMSPSDAIQLGCNILTLSRWYTGDKVVKP